MMSWWKGRKQAKLFAQWLDRTLSRAVIPDTVVAFSFNLYEDADNGWSVELVGCGSFAADDEDWAGDEITDLGTRANCYRWQAEIDWEEAAEQIQACVRAYLTRGKYAARLKQSDAVGIGFVDGDLTIVYAK